MAEVVKTPANPEPSSLSPESEVLARKLHHSLVGAIGDIRTAASDRYLTFDIPQALSIIREEKGSLAEADQFIRSNFGYSLRTIARFAVGSQQDELKDALATRVRRESSTFNGGDPYEEAFEICLDDIQFNSEILSDLSETAWKLKGGLICLFNQSARFRINLDLFKRSGEENISGWDLHVLPTGGLREIYTPAQQVLIEEVEKLHGRIEILGKQAEPLVVMSSLLLPLFKVMVEVEEAAKLEVKKIEHSLEFKISKEAFGGVKFQYYIAKFQAWLALQIQKNGVLEASQALAEAAKNRTSLLSQQGLSANGSSADEAAQRQVEPAS